MAERTPFERYWAKVQRKEPDECWPWTAATKGYGYGAIRVNGLVLQAHRYGWTIWFGDIPDGLQVLHHCDNPPCQNPWHWFLGTHADNMADRAAKGRYHYHRRNLSTSTALAVVDNSLRYPWAGR